MKALYMGYSAAFTAREIVDMITIYSGDDGQGPTDFERIFGAGYIDSGGYEVYCRDDAQGVFSETAIRALVPFRVPPGLKLFTCDFATMVSVFFVADESLWTVPDDVGVVVTDRIQIEKFDFE
jgi:hypothetical protein